MLSIDRVSAAYGDFQALFDVSLEVKAGEAVAVIGPNGAGKTTLLRAISKLVGVAGGDIRLEGQSLARIPAHEVVGRGIAHVPENRRLFPRLTVEENLRMGAFSSRNRFGERLELVYGLFPRLKERRTQAAGTLSGGEQQMVAMARALMGRPRILCMDEPTMGLSPLYVDRILELVQTVNRQGVTVFMVEQNAHLALQIAHFGYVLQTGRIALSGPARELLHDPRIRDAYLGGQAV